MARKPQFTGDGVRHATLNGHRFHLRLKDPTEDNYLWLDGRSPPLILDRVATDFVALLIDALWEVQAGEGDQSAQVRQQVVDRMFVKYGRRFAFGRARVTRERIASDLDRVFGTLMRIAKGGCPVEIGLGSRPMNVARWVAPARMDLAVTYRCNLNCPHCYMGGPKQVPELSLEQWRSVYQRLWEVGVPHVVFTGGEPTMREDLVALVGEAEEFVTGLVTNGVRLAELAAPLRDASLDYVQVTLESAQADTHNRMVGDVSGGAFAATTAGIRKALDLGMQVITNTTLTQANARDFSPLVRAAADLGLRHMSCNTIICSGRGRAARDEQGLAPDQLRATLEDARRAATDCGITLQWYSPTCYLHLNPVELGFGAKGCSAAAHNMTIQPDGTVLPCQSWPESVGNILTDPWPAIWNHPTCQKLRRHGFAEEKDECRACIHNETCGGACPLDKEGAR